MNDKRSNLWVRFNKLSFWNKLLVISAICGIIALPFTLYQCFFPNTSKDISKLLELYFDDTKVNLLKKRVQEIEFQKLKHHASILFMSLQQKDVTSSSKELNAILKIIPHDPFFRIYQNILDSKRIEQLLNGNVKVVKIIHWEQEVEGDENARLYIIMKDSQGGDEYVNGPFTNNHASIIDFPFRQYIQFKVESSGTGSFTFFPNSIRIGWAEAIKTNGEYKINKNNIEYDPDIRF